jgi:hypothetical protein
MNEEKQEIIQESMEIAKTIKSQINKTVLMCAAARNFGTIPNGLMFTISNTSKYKYATVQVILNGLDYYDIKIFNVRKKIVDTKKDIDCESLSHVLESLWEQDKILKSWGDKIPTYVFKTREA